MIFEVFGIAALFLSTVAIIIGCVALAIIIGLKNSTHQMQWVPVAEEEGLSKDKLEEMFNKPYTDLEDDENLGG